MKFKQRALALMLSMVMVLTFMPALTFADDEAAEENTQPVAEEVQEEAVPAEEAAPAEEPAPAEETAPAEEPAPAEEAAPAEEPAPAEKAAPAEEPVLVEEAASEGETTPAAKEGEKAETFTVTYHGNGGTLFDWPYYNETGEDRWVDELTFEQESGSSMHNNPSTDRDGYVCLGWATSADGKPVDYETYYIYEDVDFYAVWEKTPWATFDPTGGYLYEFNEETDSYEKYYDPVVEYSYDNVGAYFVYPKTPERVGYEFLGWTLEENSSDYVVFYDEEAGEVLRIAEDTTLYAQWKKEAYIVTFDAGEGYFVTDDGNEKTMSETYWFDNEGDPVYIESYYAPFRAGYAVSAWKDQDGKTYTLDEFREGFNITKDTTFYAQYSPAYKVTFKPDKDGNRKFKDYDDNLLSEYVVYVLKGAACKENPYYTSEDETESVIGWKDASGKELSFDDEDPYMVNADTVFYAVWAKRAAVVAHAMEGKFPYGMENEPTKTSWVNSGNDFYDYYSTFTDSGVRVFSYRDADPYLEGSVFNGWYTDEERNNLFTQRTATDEYITGLPDATLNLYAGYTSDFSTVTIEARGGRFWSGLESEEDTLEVPSGQAIDLSELVYKDDESGNRCRIKGWYNSDTGEKVELTSDGYYVPTGNITIYPEWGVALPDVYLDLEVEDYYFFLDKDYYIDAFVEADGDTSDLAYNCKIEVVDASDDEIEDLDDCETLATLTGDEYYTWDRDNEKIVLHASAIKAALDGLSVNKDDIRLRVLGTITGDGAELDRATTYVRVFEPYAVYLYEGFGSDEEALAGLTRYIEKERTGCAFSGNTGEFGEEFDYDILSLKVNGVAAKYDSDDEEYYFTVKEGANVITFTHYVYDVESGELTSEIAEESYTITGVKDRYYLYMNCSKYDVLPGETLTITAHGEHEFLTNGEYDSDYVFTYNWKRLEGLDYIEITSKVTATDNSWSRVTVKVKDGIDPSLLEDEDIECVVSCYLTANKVRKVTDEDWFDITDSYTEMVLDKTISEYMAVGSTITVTPSFKKHTYTKDKKVVTTKVDKTIFEWSFDPDVFDIKIGKTVVQNGKRYIQGAYTIKRKTAEEVEWDLTGYIYDSDEGYYEERGYKDGYVQEMYKFTNAKVYGLTDKVYTGKALYGNVSLFVDDPWDDTRWQLDKGYHYKVTYTNNTKVGTATVTITGLKNFNGCKLTRTFKINPKGTKLRTLAAGKGSFTAYWYKNAVQTSGYQIKYALNSSFTGAKYKFVKGTASLKTTVTGLSKGKYYYIKVRTYKYLNGKYYYSTWSPYLRIKTKY